MSDPGGYHATCHHGVYRLTCADYDGLWTRAGGCCELCGISAEETPSGKLCIDHDPRYGFFAVRGLLCNKCNTLMGFIDRREKDDRRAIAYYQNAWLVTVLKDRHVANVRAGIS